MKQCFFAVDLGATSGRTILGTFTPEGLEMEDVNRFPNHLIETGGHFYWDISVSYTHLGTMEITPIYGVQGNDAKDIPFLSPRWMQMLQYTESEASRLGMQIDMNTGTGWPFGGPEVGIELSLIHISCSRFGIQTNLRPRNILCRQKTCTKCKHGNTKQSIHTYFIVSSSRHPIMNGPVALASLSLIFSPI